MAEPTDLRQPLKVDLQNLSCSLTMVRSESIGGQTGAAAFYWDLSLVKNEAAASHGKETRYSCGKLLA